LDSEWKTALVISVGADDELVLAKGIEWQAGHIGSQAHLLVVANGYGRRPTHVECQSCMNS